MSAKTRCIIFGASGKTGQILCNRLPQDKYEIINVSRKANATIHLPGRGYVADLNNTDSFKDLIQANDIVINLAHARYTTPILECCPPSIKQLIVIGSTRHLTSFPDLAAKEVNHAQQQLEAWEGPWTMLHPTMIYGAVGENNIQRMALFIKKFKMIPLPNKGRSLIQPIHVEDVVMAILLAMGKQPCMQKSILIAGPKAFTYKDFITKIAAASGSNCIVISMSESLVQILAFLTRWLPFLPSITSEEVQRLMEDKNIDTHQMTQLLSLIPRDFDKGLEELFTSKK
ncbi:NAD-dependent epimerase/dehydratase family protein [Kiloniella spongiae]|uniref:NAD-dependent epimerase/dehydratase family protein n=1 Tax=Kiloniella spongiae TaxID=1489064 RepID=UPI00069A9B93|nr:NAD-dependent epimerase/dehydratase family protein [Kiloniella spongiae]